MQMLSNKIYPYPVISYDKSSSSYNGIDYTLTFDREDTEDKIVFNNVKIETNSQDLIRMLNEGKVKAIFYVDCRRSYYKHQEEIGLYPKRIEIELSNLRKEVSVSAYVYATEDIKNYTSDYFVEDYSGYSFDIDKYSLFAIDDGYSIYVDYDDINDRKVSSIFSITETEDNTEDLMKIYLDESKIIIGLPKEKCKFYNSLKDKEEFAPIFFSIIAVPALTICLKELQNENKNIDDIVEQYAWFMSIINAYKKINKMDLDDETFHQLDCFEFSQKVLNYCVVNSFEALTNIFQSSMSNLDDINDEEDL